MDDDLLSTRQVADLLGKPIGTVNRWALEKRLPTAAKVPGETGARLYRRSDVEAFKASLSEAAS